jgi:hypothetical protein
LRCCSSGSARQISFNSFRATAEHDRFGVSQSDPWSSLRLQFVTRVNSRSTPYRERVQRGVGTRLLRCNIGRLCKITADARKISTFLRSIGSFQPMIRRHNKRSNGRSIVRCGSTGTPCQAVVRAPPSLASSPPPSIRLPRQRDRGEAKHNDPRQPAAALNDLKQESDCGRRDESGSQCWRSEALTREPDSNNESLLSRARRRGKGNAPESEVCWVLIAHRSFRRRRSLSAMRSALSRDFLAVCRATPAQPPVRPRSRTTGP